MHVSGLGYEPEWMVFFFILILCWIDIETGGWMRRRIHVRTHMRTHQDGRMDEFRTSVCVMCA